MTRSWIPVPPEGAVIRRRRECLDCGHRFTTYEEIERDTLMVIKRDGRRELFGKEKLASGLHRACEKRPVSQQIVHELIDRIHNSILDEYEREVPSMVIGERIMNGLRVVDQVAYVRFASVYRRFAEATDFVQKFKSGDSPMIQLNPNCLVVLCDESQAVPTSVESLTLQILGEQASWLDAGVLKDICGAVLSYLGEEQGKQSVPFHEFAGSP